jgi:hypothetical protein
LFRSQHASLPRAYPIRSRDPFLAENDTLMWEDPIVAEVRRTREKILAEFDYDIEAYAAHIIALQEEKKRQGFKYASPPLRAARAPDPSPERMIDAQAPVHR